MKADAIYIPESPEDAARFFRGVTELKAGGANLSISFAGMEERGTEEYSGGSGLEELLKMVSSSPESDHFHTVISFERFSEVKEVSKPDLLAVAGGGTALGRLRETADGKGLFLPFDQDLFDETLTLAELVMNGAASRWEGRYGTLRESILSLGIITPSGEIIHSGSHSVKDVAGYEIAGFVLGAGGRCGMIHSVTFRLLPRPAFISYLAFSGDPADLELAAKRIFRMAAPASMEIYHGAAAKLMGGDRELKGRSLLISEIHLPVADVEKQLPAMAAEAVSGKDIDLVEGYRGESRKREFIFKAIKYSGEEKPLASLKIDLKRAVVSEKSDYLSWTGYFPMRGHYIWAVEDRDGSYPLPRGIERSISGNIAPGARVRFELLRVKKGSLRRNRLPVDSLAGSDPDLFRELINGEVISEISEKIYRLFDPERIVLV